MYTRLADKADLPEVLDYCRQFWDSLSYSKDIPFDTVTSLITITRMQAAGLLVVAEDDLELVGILGGVVNPSFVNARYLTGTELFFWVHPDYRRSGAGQLLVQAIESRARECGCALWTMIAVERMEAEKVGAFYKREGYEWVERAYAKKL